MIWFSRLWPQFPRRSYLTPAGPSAHAIPVGSFNRQLHSPFSLQSPDGIFSTGFYLKTSFPLTVIWIINTYNKNTIIYTILLQVAAFLWASTEPIPSLHLNVRDSS